MNFVHLVRAQLPLADIGGRSSDDWISEHDLLVVVGVVDVTLIGNAGELVEEGLQHGVDDLSVHVGFLHLMRLKVLRFPWQLGIDRFHHVPSSGSTGLRRLFDLRGVLDLSLLRVDFVFKSLTFWPGLLDVDLPAVDIY